MNLPVLNTHLTFELKLPVSNTHVEYKPFTAKEEFVLLTALEGGSENEMFRATKQVITNCLISKVVVGKLPMPDLEYLFMHIRGKSVGEQIKLKYVCRKPTPEGDFCGGDIGAVVNVNDINVVIPEGHTNIITLTDGESTIGIKMKYPQLDMMQSIQDESQVKMTFNMICACIDSIFKGEEVWENIPHKEIVTFVENLSQSDFGKIKDFFNTMPEMTHVVDLVCPKCDHKEKYQLKGLESFFGSWLGTQT